MQNGDVRIQAYVRAALALQGYALDEAQAGAVAEQFARVALIAGTFVDEPLPPGADPLPVFRP
jgi:hypothetical protein